MVAQENKEKNMVKIQELKALSDEHGLRFRIDQARLDEGAKSGSYIFCVAKLNTSKITK